MPIALWSTKISTAPCLRPINKVTALCHYGIRNKEIFSKFQIFKYLLLYILNDASMTINSG